MGCGPAFALAAIGALVIDHSRPEETGVSGAMNSIMRTAGAGCGAQLAAAILSARTPGGTGLPLEDGFTIAFAIGAAGLVAALAFALLVERPQPRLASRVPAISTAPSRGA